MHRIIQTLIREDLDDEEKEVARHDVHLLLAAADPDRPDDIDAWPTYDDLLAHVGPSSIIACDEPDVRRLATNMGRFLGQKGDFESRGRVAAPGRRRMDRAVPRERPLTC